MPPLCYHSNSLDDVTYVQNISTIIINVNVSIYNIKHDEKTHQNMYIIHNLLMCI